ncbi:hypothetical protein CHARACLAT_029913, partial [Characodon lateralis]|nr:hypothetical protein [Characodon lateralis]
EHDLSWLQRCITKNGDDKMHKYVYWWSLVTQKRIQALLLPIAQKTYRHRTNLIQEKTSIEIITS